MKLKLENQDNATILCITEDVAMHHIPVLKAGLTKLVKEGRKLLLLDLSATTTSDLSVLQEVASIQIWAQEIGAQLIVAHPHPNVGHAASRQEAVQILTSALAKILALEAKLQSQLKKLQKQKSDMEVRLSTLGANDGDIRKLQKENSDLKAAIAEMEAMIQHYLKRRTPAFESELFKAKNETLDKVLNIVLSQEGLLPASG